MSLRPPEHKNTPGTVTARATKRGTVYVAQLPPSRRQGRGHGDSKSFDVLADAWTWLKRDAARAELYGARPDRAGRMPLRDAMPIWIDGLAVEENTRAFYRQNLQPTWEHRLAATSVADLSPAILEALLNARNIGHTRNRVGDHLRAFCAWATANDLIDRDPWLRSTEVEKIKRKAKLYAKRRASTGKAWTVSEAREVLRALRFGAYGRDVYFAVFAYILVTGARRGEALGLAWATVDGHTAKAERNRTLAAGRIFTRDRPKNHVVRDTFYGPNLAEILDGLRPRVVRPDGYVFRTADGEPHSPDAVSAAVASIARVLGLPHIGGTHGLRRTFATALDEAGCPERVREALLGHDKSEYVVSHEDQMIKWGELADEIFLGPSLPGW